VVERVLELAHVARPGVVHEELLGLGRERHVPVRELVADERAAEEEHVLPAAPERRHLELEDGDAVVEIRPEAIGRDLVPELFVRGGHDAKIRGDVRRAADATEGFLLHGAEQLGLERRGQLGHLVEEQRAPRVQ
jgi:hypothetical protein